MPSSNRIKLVSLNIERDRHYARFLPFLKKEAPAIVCLQEALDRDVKHFETELGMKSVYAPVSLPDNGPGARALAEAGVKSGQGLFTSLAVEASGVVRYCDCPEPVLLLPDSRHWHKFFVWARLSVRGALLTVATTHFTWTPDGQASDEQRRDMDALLENLRQFPELVLCGDFNAPRGGEMWARLAAAYTDNIPQRCDSSLDPVLHRKKGLRYVVDGLFTTSGYTARDVRLAGGVSDHMAVVGYIRRVQ